MTKDIEGAVPNAFGKISNIKGRDYINITDIKGTQSKYKIDKFSNKTHFNLETKDVTEDGKRIFKKDYNLLNPHYVMYTKSRRGKMVIQDDSESKPKRFISPHTRRHNNHIEDIEGTKPKKRTWVRKIGDMSDDGSEFNTSLPLGNGKSKAFRRSNAYNNMFQSYEQPTESKRKIASQLDIYTQRNKDHGTFDFQTQNEGKSNRNDQARYFRSGEKKNTFGTRRSSHSPSYHYHNKTGNELPKLSAPDIPKAPVNKNTQRDTKSKQMKYSNFIIHDNSRMKASRDLRYFKLSNI